jgi:hypothetical protein
MIKQTFETGGQATCASLTGLGGPWTGGRAVWRVFLVHGTVLAPCAPVGPSPDRETVSDTTTQNHPFERASIRTAAAPPPTISPLPQASISVL